MSLLALTLAHTSPSYVQEFLGKHFDRVLIMQTRHDSVYHHALACLDPRNRLRLIVCFGWIAGRWQYAIVRPGEATLKSIED